MKKVIGIISCVLFIIIELQSCVVGLGNTIFEANESSGSIGIILGIFMLVAGILALISKDHKGILITSIVLYILGGLMGLLGSGTFSDLKVWSSLNLIFGIMLLVQFLRNNSFKLNKFQFKKLKTRTYIIIFLVLCLLAVFVGYLMANSKSSAVVEKMPSQDIIQTYTATVATYSELLRSPDTYKNKKIAIQGTVMQINESWNKVTLKVALRNDSNNPIVVTYTTGKDYKRILERDKVTILGNSQGLSNNLPSMSADYITLGN